MRKPTTYPHAAVKPTIFVMGFMHIHLLFLLLFFSWLDGLPLPPLPALGVKVLDCWKYQQSNKAARLQATLGVGQINISS